MRRIPVLLLVISLSSVWADDTPEREAEAVTPEEAANAAWAAYRGHDVEALQALAARDDPDPWLVADVLLMRGEATAALAFAKGAPRKDTEALPDYVERCQGAPSDASWRKRLSALSAALAKKDVRAALEIAESPAAFPNTVTGVRLRHARGMALRAAERHEEGVAALREAAAAAQDLGWLRRAAALLGTIGRSLGLETDTKGALTLWRRCLALNVTRSDRAGTAVALEWLAIVHVRRADYPKALSLRQRALAIYRELEDRPGEARQLGAIGFTHVYLGDYAESLSYFERSLALSESLDDKSAVAQTTGRIGDLHFFLGEFPMALAFYERECSLREELEDRAGVASALLGIGSVYQQIGDRASARARFDRSLALAEELKHLGHMASALGLIGGLHREAEDYETALEYYRRVVALHERRNDRYWMAMRLLEVAEIHQTLDDPKAAVSIAERALSIMEDLDARFGVGCALSDLGKLHAEQGNRDEAVRVLDRAIRQAKRIRSRELVVFNTIELARVHLDAGEPGRALATARRGLTELEFLLGGLAEGEGATGRQKYADLYSVGVRAAARVGDRPAVLEFLESGRAGALLETLGGGRAARYAKLPKHLLEAEAAAKAAEAEAHREHDRALEGGVRSEIQAAVKAVDAVMDRRRQVAARVQREAKRVAGVFYPRVALLEEIQDWLEPDVALVLYGLFEPEALALVITADGTRLVELGSVRAVDAACATLAALLEEPGSATSPAEGDGEPPSPTPADALHALRALLVDPLALGEAIRTVLVSPDGALGYVPWAALVDRPVACVPSGTTWVLLKEDVREPGTMILALGDPTYRTRLGDRASAVYRGGRLLPLPATREEAKAIGDVVLLGDQATEGGLAEALRKQQRWRAVHLACHGLIDSERPLLSSLALTPLGEDDGYLTCLEVFGLDVPADLLVLSACETARGKVAEAEGIVGLTRAFMYAGCPRIVCSLWMVDDEATRVLMTRFYEMWSPKDGSQTVDAALALQRAQQHVRDHPDHPEWSHPHYWAAWQLWGLSE